MGRAHASKLVLIAGLFTATPMAWAGAGEPDAAFGPAWDRVENLRLKAAEQGFEWLQIAVLLQEARTAHAEGAQEQGWRLLRQAEVQVEQSLAQARREAEAWKRRVVR